MKRKFKRNLFNEEKLKSWAISIKQLDGYKCVACGYKYKLHSHHILKKSKFRQYAYNIHNGITLCVLCHIGKNGVHGSGKARNKMVSTLRALGKTNNFKKVSDFVKSLRNHKQPINITYKKTKRFKKIKKFKFYRKYY